jgi:translation initiation factor IF-3
MIRVKQVRVIDEEGNQLGILSPIDAMREANERGYDLVEVAPNGQPPVCRIMDYGKYKYQQAKRAKESKKHQHTVSIKEVKFRPKIGVHDFDYKINHAKEFLSEGNKVKITVMFRGREMAHPEFGHEILKRVMAELADMVIERPEPSMQRLEGRTMTMMLTPTKEAAAQARKLKEESRAATREELRRREEERQEEARKKQLLAKGATDDGEQVEAETEAAVVEQAEAVTEAAAVEQTEAVTEAAAVEQAEAETVTDEAEQTADAGEAGEAPPKKD